MTQDADEILTQIVENLVDRCEKWKGRYTEQAERFDAELKRVQVNHEENVNHMRAIINECHEKVRKLEAELASLKETTSQNALDTSGEAS